MRTINKIHTQGLLCGLALMGMTTALDAKDDVATPATIFHQATQSVSYMNKVLATAEGSPITGWTPAAAISRSKPGDAFSGNHAYQWALYGKHRAAHFELTPGALNEAGAIQVHVKTSPGDQVELTLALVERGGEVWTQRTSTTVGDRYTALKADLHPQLWHLAEKGEENDAILQWSDIVAIRFLVADPSAAQQVFIDDIVLPGMNSQDVSIKTSVLKKEATNALQVLFDTDSSSPNIDTLTVNGDDVRQGQAMSKTPRIDAALSDAQSGVGTWNVEIVNETDQVVVQRISGHGGLSRDPVVIAAEVSKPLTGGSYTARVTVNNGKGMANDAKTQTFIISTALGVTETLAGPNPFNPNQESTNLQYALSKDADVDIRIYSISGEELWTTSLSAGSSGASSGTNSVVWNGRNQYGETVANGVYVAYLMAKSGSDRESEKIKIMVLK